MPWATCRNGLPTAISNRPEATGALTRLDSKRTAGYGFTSLDPRDILPNKYKTVESCRMDMQQIGTKLTLDVLSLERDVLASWVPANRFAALKSG